MGDVTQADLDAATRRLAEQLRDEMKNLKTPGIPPTSLPKYRGRADTRTFKEYLDVFYDVALTYDWNEARKCQMLGSALEGEARAAYQTVADADKTNWKRLVEKLGEKLTFHDNVAHMRSRLQNRTQKPHESTAEYALDVRYLVEKAFPESKLYSAAQRKDNEIEYFLRGLRPQIKEQLIRRDTPNTLEEAIDLARKEEQLQLDIRRDYSDRAQLVASVRTDEELQAAASRMERGIEKGFEKVIHKLDKLSVKEPTEQKEQKQSKERARSTSPPKREWYNSGAYQASQPQNVPWNQSFQVQPQLVIPATVAAISAAPQAAASQTPEPPQWFRDWETKQRWKQQQDAPGYQSRGGAPRAGFQGARSRGFSRGGFQRGPPGNFGYQRPPYRNDNGYRPQSFGNASYNPRPWQPQYANNRGTVPPRGNYNKRRDITPREQRESTPYPSAPPAQPEPEKSGKGRYNINAITMPALCVLALVAILQPVSAEQVFQICSKSRGGTLIARPETQNCTLPPHEKAFKAMAEVFVPRTRPLLLEAFHCYNLTRTRCTSFVFGFSTKEHLGQPTQSAVTIEECWRMVQDKEWHGSSLNPSDADLWMTRNHFSRDRKGWFGEHCEAVHNGVLIRGQVGVLHDDTLVSDLDDVSECRPDHRSCSRHNGVTVWKQPEPREACIYESSGNYSAVVTAEYIMVEHLQSAWTFANFTIDPAVSSCIPEGSFVMDNRAVIVLYNNQKNRRKRSSEPDTILRSLVADPVTITGTVYRLTYNPKYWKPTLSPLAYAEPSNVGRYRYAKVVQKYRANALTTTQEPATTLPTLDINPCRRKENKWPHVPPRQVLHVIHNVSYGVPVWKFQTTLGEEFTHHRELPHGTDVVNAHNGTIHRVFWEDDTVHLFRRRKWEYEESKCLSPLLAAQGAQWMDPSFVPLRTSEEIMSQEELATFLVDWKRVSKRLEELAQEKEEETRALARSRPRRKVDSHEPQEDDAADKRDAAEMLRRMQAKQAELEAQRRAKLGLTPSPQPSQSGQPSPSPPSTTQIPARQPSTNAQPKPTPTPKRGATPNASPTTTKAPSSPVAHKEPTPATKEPTIPGSKPTQASKLSPTRAPTAPPKAPNVPQKAATTSKPTATQPPATTSARPATTTVPPRPLTPSTTNIPSPPPSTAAASGLFRPPSGSRNVRSTTATEAAPQAGKEDLSSANARLEFFAYHLEEELDVEFGRVWRQMCEISNRQTLGTLQMLQLSPTLGMRESLRRDDVHAESAGDAYRVSLCKQVIPRAIHWNHQIGEKCYDALPVRVDNQTWYVHTGTRELQPFSTEIPCSQRSLAAYRAPNGTWFTRNGPVNVVSLHDKMGMPAKQEHIHLDAPSIYNSHLAPVQTTIALLSKYVRKTNRLEQLVKAHVTPPAHLQSVWSNPAEAVEDLFYQLEVAAHNSTNATLSWVSSSWTSVQTVWTDWQHTVRTVAVLGLVAVAAFMVIYTAPWWSACFRRQRNFVNAVRLASAQNTLNGNTPPPRPPPPTRNEDIEMATVCRIAGSPQEETPLTPEQRAILDRMPYYPACCRVSWADEAHVSPPVVEVKVNGVRTKALFDCGSCLTLCKQSVAARCNITNIRPCTRPGIAANGTIFSFIGEAEVPIELAPDVIVAAHMRIAADNHCAEPLLIGTDVMSKLSEMSLPIGLDWSKGEVKVGEKILAMINAVQLAPEIKPSVIMPKTTIFPPRSDTFMVLDTDQDLEPGSEWFVAQVPHGHDIHVGKSVACPDNTRKVAVRILNPGCARVKVYKGTRVAELERVLKCCTRGPFFAIGPVDEDDICCPEPHQHDLPSEEEEAPEAHWEAALPRLPDAEEPTLDLSKSVLSEAAKERLREIVASHPEAFVQKDGIIGNYTGPVVHRIDTVQGSVPFQTRPYRLPVALREEVERQIEDMLRQHIIQPSTSNFCSPIVMVRKADKKSWRFAVDYRKLNAITVKQTYYLPLIQDILDLVGGKRIYSNFDLQSGFHQISVHPDHVERTAFGTFLGLYEFLRMPFGLCSAPSTFQKAMEAMRRELTAAFYVYLDDIVLASDDEEQHLADLDQLLRVLTKYGLKLRLDKCTWARDEIKYLGFLVSEKGIRPDPKNLEAVRKFKPPRTMTELKSLIGALNYFRRFVPKFSEIMAPLNDLCKKGSTERWSTIHDHALETMKEKLTNAPVLAPAKFGQPFIVETDASATAIAACLLQKNSEGEAHPIAFASRKLNKHEARYPSVESEALAIVFALKSFAPYLEGAGHSIVRTDNSALTSLMRNKDLTGRLAKYQMTIQHADISIEHRSGRSNTFCDFLSRYPVTEDAAQQHDPAQTYRPMADGVWTEISSKAWLFTTENVVGRARILGLDLDGTLIRTRSGRSFPADRDDWELAHTSIPRTLRVHHTSGYKICVFTNQFGLAVGKVNAEDFRQRIQQICAAIGAPMQVFIALDTKYFRKPQTGLWEWLASEANDGVPIETDDCTFVGDSAGRPWTMERPADHSNYDREFAANVGMTFKTPEEFFPPERTQAVVAAVREETAQLTTLQRVRYEQRAVPEYQRIFEALVEERWPNNEHERNKLKEVVRSYQVRGGAIYYVEPDADDALPRLLIPYPLRATIIKEFHEQAIQGSHLGTQKTIAQLKKRVFWPNLARDVADVLRGCGACQRRKVNPSQTAHAPINPIPAPRFPLERVHTDLVGPLPETDGQYKYMLTAICALTKYLIAVPLKDMKATSVVRALVDHVFTKYGVCSTLVTDNGRQFTSQVFKDFRKLYGFSHVFTTTYHPEGNGQIERAHRTLAAMLSAYTEEQGRNWSDFLQVCTFAANNSIQASTRQTPFFLMHYRDALLPSDLALEIPPKTVLGSGTTFLQDQSTGIREAWQSAQNNISLAQQRQKDFADEYNRARDRDFQPQDLVLIFRDQLPRDRAHKFRLPYEGPYRVLGVEKPNLIVRDLDELSHPFTVHSNKCKFFFQPATLPLRRRELSTYAEAYKHREPGDRHIVAEAESDSDSVEEETQPERPEGPHPIPEPALRVNMVRWPTAEDLRRDSPSPPAETSRLMATGDITQILPPYDESGLRILPFNPKNPGLQIVRNPNNRPPCRYATLLEPEGGDTNLLTEHIADFFCGLHRRDNAITLWRDAAQDRELFGQGALESLGIYAKLPEGSMDLYHAEYDISVLFKLLREPVLFMHWPTIRASTTPEGLIDQFPVEKVYVWYHRDSEWGEQRWSPRGARYPEFSVLNTIARKRAELAEEETHSPSPPAEAADPTSSPTSPANADAGSPSEAFEQREADHGVNPTELTARRESHRELDAIQGFTNQEDTGERYFERFPSDRSTSSDILNTYPPTGPRMETPESQEYGTNSLDDYPHWDPESEDAAQDGTEPRSYWSHTSESTAAQHNPSPAIDVPQNSATRRMRRSSSDMSISEDENEQESEPSEDLTDGGIQSTHYESSDSSGSTSTSRLRAATALKKEADEILRESRVINQQTRELLAARRLPPIVTTSQEGLEPETLALEDNGDIHSRHTTALRSLASQLTDLRKTTEALVEESRRAIQQFAEQDERQQEQAENPQQARNVEPPGETPEGPRLSFRAREAVCAHIGIPWELNLVQQYQKGQPVYVGGGVQPLPFQIIVSVGVVLDFGESPRTYKVIYDTVQEDRAPTTPYNLWQTHTIRASELFPRNHGQNAGFVVSLFNKDRSRCIGRPATIRHTLQSVSSVANRSVILQALGLPDNYYRFTTPRFSVGQAVYVSRGSDEEKQAFRYDPGTITGVHVGNEPGWHGGYTVKVDTFDQPAVTWKAHITGYEAPFNPEEIYDRRLECGAVWIPSAFPSLQTGPHNEADNRVFYEEPLWQYLCQRYSYATTQELCEAFYEMTPQRRQEISAHVQKLCIVGRFKQMEVRIESLRIDGTRSARDVPMEGSFDGSVREFFTSQREDLCHPRWPVIYHQDSDVFGGAKNDPIAVWPLETLVVVWPQTLCTKEERTRISVAEFAKQFYGVREIGDVWRRLADMRERLVFEHVLRQRRVAGHFQDLMFQFTNFLLQDDPGVSQCLGPTPSTSSVAHFLHLHSQDVRQQRGFILLNLDHLAENARDPLGAWPMDLLTVAL